MENQEPDEPVEPSLENKNRQVIKLGGDLLREANAKVENHFSKTVDDFKSNNLELGSARRFPLVWTS